MQLAVNSLIGRRHDAYNNKTENVTIETSFFNCMLRFFRAKLFKAVRTKYSKLIWK